MDRTEAQYYYDKCIQKSFVMSQFAILRYVCSQRLLAYHHADSEQTNEDITIALKIMTKHFKYDENVNKAITLRRKLHQPPLD